MLDSMNLRDTKLYINLKKLETNVKNVKTLLGPDVDLMVVVKANGYGHGAVEIADTIMNAGASYLSVATLSEAMELRLAGKNYPILIMGHTPDQYLNHAVENDITLTVFSSAQAKKISALALASGRTAKVHIKIDTGFHRLGLNAEDLEGTLAEIREICSLKGVEAEGIFSHLALTGDAENDRQYELLTDIISALRYEDITFRYEHIADSIALVDYPQYRMNMVRAGALVYGMVGFSIGHVDVEQILTFKTSVSQLHHLKAGEGVSYDYLWKAPADSVIATLPFGYADGYPRNMRDKGYVTIKGIRCPLVGVLCMDQVMADVTAVSDIKEGDEAVIYGTGPGEMTIQEASLLGGTNKNEIISRLMSRPQRVYVYE